MSIYHSFSDWSNDSQAAIYKQVASIVYVITRLPRIRRISCVVMDKERKMQQTSTIQIEQKMIGQLRKISTHNILPTHNGALSHVAACVATLGFVIYSSSEKSENKEWLIMKYLDSVVHFVHLLTFATWVGIQVWVHVSGRTPILYLI